MNYFTAEGVWRRDRNSDPVERNRQKLTEMTPTHTFRYDQLKPNAEEESVDVMVADVEWIDHDIIVFARLKETIDMGLERSNARFVVVLLAVDVNLWNVGEDLARASQRQIYAPV